MKTLTKKLSLLIVVLLAGFGAYAQGFEFSVNTGLAFPVAGSYIASEDAGLGFYELNPQGDRTALVTTGGGGINLGVTGGYNFNEYVGLHLNVNYLLGLKGEFVQHPATISFKGGATSVTPLVKITASNDKTVNLYTKLGVSLIFAKADMGITVTGVPGEQKFELSGNSALGWLGGFGADIKAGEKLKVYVELETRLATWNPEKLTNTENFGGPLAPELTFDKNVKANDPPTKALTLSVPINSLALNVGVRF